MFHAWNIFFSFNSIFVANTSIFESSPAFFSWSVFPIHLIGKYNMKSHVKKCVQRKVEYFSFTDIVFSRGRLYPAFNKISPISLKATEESREESRDYIDFCFFSFPLCSKTSGGSRDKKVQWKKKVAIFSTRSSQGSSTHSKQDQLACLVQNWKKVNIVINNHNGN